MTIGSGTMKLLTSLVFLFSFPIMKTAEAKNWNPYTDMESMGNEIYNDIFPSLNEVGSVIKLSFLSPLSRTVQFGNVIKKDNFCR